MWCGAAAQHRRAGRPKTRERSSARPLTRRLPLATPPQVRLRDPSGRPVIEGESLDVEEGDLWVFFASRSMHETSTIQGTEPRVVYGWGWSVPPGHALGPPPE